MEVKGRCKYHNKDLEGEPKFYPMKDTWTFDASEMGCSGPFPDGTNWELYDREVERCSTSWYWVLRSEPGNYDLSIEEGVLELIL